MYFEIIGEIKGIQIIASGNSILEIGRLNKYHGKGRWRKMKGFARIKLDDANIHEAELHWYEAHGIDKKEYKIKQYINK